MKPTIGLIAGSGKLPLLLAANIRTAGHRLVIIGYNGVTRKDLGRYANGFHWVHIGELGRTIQWLAEEGAKQVIFAGEISKKHFFSKAKPDARAIQVLLRLPDKKDDAILRAIAREMESEGMEVISPSFYLAEQMAPRGVLTERKPTEREQRDIDFGWSMAKKLGELDVGQTLVVKDQIVLAMEAIEGTDAAIRRGGKLGRRDVTVIKIFKPKQDPRLDLPVIGPATIKTLEKAGASLLAVEAGRTIIIDKEKVIPEANRNGLCLIGV
jgi:UDP-2,3-diacylglucosamine hydrolase